LRELHRATDVFLRLNGWKLEVDAHEAHELINRLLETHTADVNHLLPWITASLEKLD
jgi:prophage maintenance system killer protein